MHRRHARHRMHDRDGRLAAAGDHVQVRLVGMLGEVHHRDDIRAGGCRGEVDDAYPMGTQLAVMHLVRPSGGGIEGDADFLEIGQREQPVDPACGGGYTEALSAGQTV
ncbi:hypothetical protein D3C81_551600 [compost metagenome]